MEHCATDRVILCYQPCNIVKHVLQGGFYATSRFPGKLSFFGLKADTPFALSKWRLPEIVVALRPHRYPPLV